MGSPYGGRTNNSEARGGAHVELDRCETRAIPNIYLEGRDSWNWPTQNECGAHLTETKSFVQLTRQYVKPRLSPTSAKKSLEVAGSAFNYVLRCFSCPRWQRYSLIRERCGQLSTVRFYCYRPLDGVYGVCGPHPQYMLDTPSLIVG